MNSTKICNTTEEFCGLVPETKSYNGISLAFLILLITAGTYTLSIYTLLYFKHLQRKVPGFKFIAEVIISHLIFLCAYPIIGTVFLLNFIVRFLVSCYLKCMYGNNVKLLHGSDGYWVPDSPGCPSIIEQFHVMKGDCKLDRIRQVFHRGALQEKDKSHFDVLQFKLVTIFGYYCWVKDENWDVARHVRYIFPDSPKRLVTEDEVTAELSRVHKNPFPLDRPPWEVLVVPKFDYRDPGREEGSNYYALLYRINHGCLDGLSFINVANKVICDTPKPLIVDPRTPIKITFLQSAAMYFTMFLLGPRTILSSALINDKNCFHGPQLKGHQCFVRTKPFDFEVIKQIKVKTNSTIMSIFLTVIAGAMKNLAKQKHLPIPKGIQAGLTCAILPYKCDSPKNQFSMALVPISVGKNETPKILEYTTSSIKTLGKSIDPLLNYYGIKIIGMLPARLGKVISDTFNASFVLTNLPAAKVPWRCFGDPVVGFTGWNLIKITTGLGVLISTYAGKIQFSLVGDAANYTDEEDVPTLAAEMEREMQKLAVHVGIPEENVFFTEF